MRGVLTCGGVGVCGQGAGEGRTHHTATAVTCGVGRSSTSSPNAVTNKPTANAVATAAEGPPAAALVVNALLTQAGRPVRNSSRMRSPDEPRRCIGGRPVSLEGKLYRRALPVVASAADRVAEGAEEEQDDSDEEQDDPDRPQDADVQDESDDEQDDAKCDHGVLLSLRPVCRPL